MISKGALSKGASIQKTEMTAIKTVQKKYMIELPETDSHSIVEAIELKK